MSDSKKRKYHHGNLREALIQASLELIEEAEPHTFTMREAAKRAGVAVSAPYRHFANKAALMMAIAEEGATLMNTVMKEEMAKAEDPEDKFHAMGIAFVKFAVKYPSYFRVLHKPEHVGSEMSPKLQAAFAENKAMVVELFGGMQQGEKLGEGLPILQFLAAQSMTYGLARMFVDGQMARLGIKDTQAELLVRAVTSILGLGLLPRQASKPPESQDPLSTEETQEVMTLLAPMFQGFNK